MQKRSIIAQNFSKDVYTVYIWSVDIKWFFLQVVIALKWRKIEKIPFFMSL